MVTKNKITILAGMLLFIALGVFYKFFFYEYIEWFPKCPFRSITGFQCPGCGSQRAVSSLMNLDIIKAFKENRLLVISIPYLLFYYVLELNNEKTPGTLELKKRFFGVIAIRYILIIIILFWILRNI